MPFWKQAGRLLNSGQTRTLLLSGNIHDLFPTGKGRERDYVPLVDFLCGKWDLSSLILVVYELNGPIRFLHERDRKQVRRAWTRWRRGMDGGRSEEDERAIRKMLATSSRERASLEEGDLGSEHFDRKLHSAIGRPTMALELLRQMCLCSRTELDGEPLLARNLVIFFEGADLVLPDAPVHNLSDADRHRVAICQDWFLDPGFQRGGDSVLLLCESRSLLNQRVARLPQVLGVEVPAPGVAARQSFLDWFQTRPEREGRPVPLWGTPAELAEMSAGLTLHALWQLLLAAAHEERPLEPGDVVQKVEEHVQRELGEDIVEFKRPHHRLDDLIGFRSLKGFLREELIPRFQGGGEGALAGATVCGPIGAGKTFVFEAVAAELDMPVLVLKSIRSQWFGQTDVILERLRRVLEAFAKVLLFVDEADTQFGGVGAGSHSTERRLTGKIQAMMSDPRLRGRVLWLLMTARVHLLSPDIRRPGRAGDLILPVLDPEGEDRQDFLRWVVDGVWQGEPGEDDLAALEDATRGYFAASFSSLRSELRATAARQGGHLSPEAVLAAVRERLAPPIGATRRYQKLQALVNCTRRSLLPEGEGEREEDREAWIEEIRQLEARGIH